MSPKNYNGYSKFDRSYRWLVLICIITASLIIGFVTYEICLYILEKKTNTSTPTPTLTLTNVTTSLPPCNSHDSSSSLYYKRCLIYTNLNVEKCLNAIAFTHGCYCVHCKDLFTHTEENNAEPTTYTIY